MDNADQSKWFEFIDEGRRYLKTATNGAEKRKTVFTPEIIYNIVAMSIEKHIMGYLVFNNCLPDNHTIGDLVNAVRMIHPFESTLFKKLEGMDRFQEICSIDQYSRISPEEKDVREFLEIGKEVQVFVEAQLQPE